MKETKDKYRQTLAQLSDNARFLAQHSLVGRADFCELDELQKLLDKAFELLEKENTK